MNVIDIGGRRELFWDDYMIDTDNTTATPFLHQPTKKDLVLHLTMDWEGDGCDYYNIMKDGNLYRMYYLGWKMLNPSKTEHTGSDIKVCYAESRDGIHWTRPDLHIKNYDGDTNNNIILDREDGICNDFFAFKDENPKSTPAKKYKAVAEMPDGTLWSFISKDALHWKKFRLVSKKGRFDTLNVAFWDSLTNKYYCYIRDFHDNEETDEYSIRDIRVITSEDFREWTDPVRISFGDGAADYPLYTNNITPYYRAPHIWTGFPTRYVQKPEWLPNFDDMPNPASRRLRSKIDPRLGITLTDCVFMSTRDGYNFHRFDEAWLTPGPETRWNWVYGNCYPACGMIETSTGEKDSDNELSMYCFEGKWTCQPSKLFRYTVRIDGFVSYHATFKPQILTTKPFTFKGSKLKINFATSAIGKIFIKILDKNGKEIEGFKSNEIFGDRVDREVKFEKSLAELHGKPIKLEFTMSDADIYSFIFED